MSNYDRSRNREHNYCDIQRFPRRNAEDLISNKNIFAYGSSTRGQQIECWWSILRRTRLN